jgi:predicted GH43/DUF377 family glycosyl hydrolase
MGSADKPKRRGRLQARQLPIKVDKDIRRVVTLPFSVDAYAQVAYLFDRVGRLTDEQVDQALASVLERFSLRHEDIEGRFEKNYDLAAKRVQSDGDPAPSRRLLIGAYLTTEYSIEAAALFNPSMTPHPDQTGAPPGGLRFIMSLRAVGEGHVSSTVFQTGWIADTGAVALDPPGSVSTRTRVKPDQSYSKPLFSRKLGEMAVHMATASVVLGRLPQEFTFDQIEEAIARVKAESDDLPQLERTTASMIWLARANYQLALDPSDDISDLILFPRSDNEARGIEDLRLVRFTEEDESTTYYGTYNAFDGQHVLPMLMETHDFRTIKMHTLNGACVQNKGMALFPRRIDGHYVMCSRIDGRNLFLMFSDYVHFWETARILAEPKFPWELRLIGNCGSPLETPEGWLLITHGVGPMRSYSIGAMLLDAEDPFRIRGRLREPLLVPPEEEREGYVPNVVYSCGSLIHNGQVVLPYAVSDMATRIATVPLDELLDQLLSDGP